MELFVSHGLLVCLMSSAICPIWPRVGNLIGLIHLCIHWSWGYFRSSQDRISSAWSTPKRQAITKLPDGASVSLPVGESGAGGANQPLETWAMESPQSAWPSRRPDARARSWNRSEFRPHVSFMSFGGRFELPIGYSPGCSNSPYSWESGNEFPYPRSPPKRKDCARRSRATVRNDCGAAFPASGNADPHFFGVSAALVAISPHLCQSGCPKFPRLLHIHILYEF